MIFTGMLSGIVGGGHGHAPTLAEKSPRSEHSLPRSTEEHKNKNRRLRLWKLMLTLLSLHTVNLG